MIELKDVEFRVESAKGKLEIIDKINLKIDSGKFIVITGPNGGGKSTLAKLIMGIEKPTSGKILFDGIDMKGQSSASATAFRHLRVLKGLQFVSF